MTENEIAETKADIEAALRARVPDDRRVQDLLVICMGNALMRVHRSGEDWADVFLGNLTTVGHIVDWLAVSVANEEAWLTRLDKNNRPLKLAKMHSIEQIKGEADKAMLKLNQKIGTKPLDPSNELLEIELDDGYRMVKLLTPQALDRESSLMQHCVGHGSYDTRLANGTIAIYSLRDRNNHPHVTIEVETKKKTIAQFKGKQNALPNQEYLARSVPFFRARGPFGGLEELGVILDAEGNIHDRTNIPDGCVFHSLRLEQWRNEAVRTPGSIEVLDELKVSGAFGALLSGACVVRGKLTGEKLADVVISPDAEFHGDVVLPACVGIVFPPRLHIRGSLIIKGGRDIVLPSDLTVDGDMDISETVGVTPPDRLVVRKRLLAQGSDLTSIGREVGVGGSSMLSDMQNLLALPDVFEVGDNLLLRGNPVREIHEGVTVLGTLMLDKAALAETVVAEGARLGRGVQSRQPNGGFLPVDPETLRGSRRAFAA